MYPRARFASVFRQKKKTHLLGTTAAKQVLGYIKNITPYPKKAQTVFLLRTGPPHKRLSGFLPKNLKAECLSLNPFRKEKDFEGGGRFGGYGKVG